MQIISDKKDILDYHVEKVKKAYPAYFDSYKNFPEVKEYLNKISNLYCIGRNGQHRYNNMDHSMETAIIAAKSILNNDLELKESIWNVNTEQTYHEESNHEKIIDKFKNFNPCKPLAILYILLIITISFLL